MYCYNCGKEVDDNNQFCPYCGAKLKTSDQTGEKKKAKKEKQVEVKNPKAKIIVIVCLIVVCLAAIAFLLISRLGNKNQMVVADNISVLDYDVDWDSSYYDEQCDTYKVDIIMLVENNAGADISGTEFTLENTNGTEIKNALNQDYVFSASGYVKDGERAIMAGELWFNSKEKVESVDLESAVAFAGPENYTVPSGVISEKGGVNDDFYSIKMDNPNEIAVNTTATLVAVVIDGKNIVDSDATGRIETALEAGSADEYFKNAFQDPGLGREYTKYKVYAIDETNYR